VLFLSTHGAVRSPIAAAWLRSIGGQDFEAESAGFASAEALDPATIQVMREVGLDLADSRPRSVADLQIADFDVVVILRPRETSEADSPLVGAREVLHWSFPPLADAQAQGEVERLMTARRMRDELRTRVALLVTTTTRHTKRWP
jgi:arsenate reductase